MDWLERSKAILRKACSSWGIAASLTTEENYGRIFTRDAVMAGIAGLLLEDKTIIGGFENTLNQLRELQGKQGQIPSNFKVEEGRVTTVSFGTLSPKIDSCTWYLIGVGVLAKDGNIEKERFKESVEKTIHLLEGIEYNDKHLMYIPKGGNWADEYIYEGYILYDQVLRAWGLALLADIYGNVDWYEKSKAIVQTVQSSFKKKGQSYFCSSIYPGGSFDKFDLPAHAILGIILNKDVRFFDDTLNWISNTFLSQKKMPSAFYPVITEEDSEWKTLNNYFLYRFKNHPHHFHNGGIWWIWLGWLAISLSLWDKKDALEDLLNLTNEWLEKNRSIFDFEEYLSSDQLELHGTTKLCFTATGIIFLQLAQKGFVFSKLRPSTSPSINEPIIIKKEYFALSKELIKHLEQANQLNKKKLVIGISGESGSGKSVTAKSLQFELDKLNIHSVILHQDGYYKLPPKENQMERKNNINWVGLNEINMNLWQQHIRQFKENEKVINIPVVNYLKNEFTENYSILADKSVMIVEGVYSFFLKGLDYKIFMSRTYQDTLERRKERSREEYDPFIEEVLAIEQSIVLNRINMADSVISKDYELMKSSEFFKAQQVVQKSQK